jgi:integrase
MAKIKFFIQSKNNPAGIYVRIRDGVKIDAKAKTKWNVNPSDWSEIKGQYKNLKDEHFKKLNEDQEEWKNNLLKHFNNQIGNTEINSSWLKDFIHPPEKKTSVLPTKLVDYFDYYSLHKKSSLKASSHTKLNVNKHLIEKFQKQSKREYFIKDVDANFKLNFEAFCRMNGYAQNTIARTIKFIKTICYHAQTNLIETSPQLKSIQIDTQKVDKIFLSIKEIEQIEIADLKGMDAFLNARDWLLISCETGQRVSDFLRFTKEMIRFNNGKPLIEFTQVKTDKIMTVPLSKKVMEILQKYNGNFPRKISDQRYNEHIKNVCKIAKLTQLVKGSIQNKETKMKISGIYEKWQLVTSHIGRRSFATNNYGRIPTSLLIGATGHSTEKMFLEYIGKSDTEKAMQLAEYF